MKKLFVMRHAKSSWSNEGLSDYERPLNPRGTKDAPRMGKLLLDNDLVPDLILTSSAKRAHTTAELVAMASNYNQEVMYVQKFYQADPTTYLSVLQQLTTDPQKVMVVGHNPGISDLLSRLSGQYVGMTTANIGVVALPITQWSEIRLYTKGDLLHLWRPREIE